MKRITAIIRMNRMNQTRQALVEAGFPAFTVRKVLGRGLGQVDFRVLHGAEAGQTEAIAHLKDDGPMLVPKRMMTIVVPDADADKVVQTVITANKTATRATAKFSSRPWPRPSAFARASAAPTPSISTDPLHHRTTMNDTDASQPLADAAEAAREEMLKIYPPKTRKKRAKQMVVNDPDTPPEIGANTRTIPGIITQRGCTYAGCRGVVMGRSTICCRSRTARSAAATTRGSHGATSRVRRKAVRIFLQYAMSTDMQEEQIVFGGEKKLAQAIREAYAIFKPKAIAILSTCPVGLIGDDVHAVARQMKEELGINVVGFSCEGYKGVSQSAATTSRTTACSST